MSGFLLYTNELFLIGYLLPPIQESLHARYRFTSISALAKVRYFPFSSTNRNFATFMIFLRLTVFYDDHIDFGMTICNRNHFDRINPGW